MDVATGELVDGPIDRCRYSGVAWLPGGKAFYYMRRLPPEAVPDGEAQYHRRVYLHVVGTAPETDARGVRRRARQDHLLRGKRQQGRALADHLGVDRHRAARRRLDRRPVRVRPGARRRSSRSMVGLDAMASPRVGRDGKLYVFTDLDAPRGRICVADPAAPGPAGWRDLFAEDPSAVLRSYAILDGQELARPVLVVSRHQARDQRGQRARPGHRVAPGGARAAGDRVRRRDRRAARGRARGVVRLHRLHDSRRWYSATTPRRARVDTWATPPGRRSSERRPGGTASQVTYHPRTARKSGW